MGAPKLRLTPEQASALAILAQHYRVGAQLSQYKPLVDELHGDALAVAKLLYGELPASQANPKQKEAAQYLRNWVSSLGSPTAVAV